MTEDDISNILGQTLVDALPGWTVVFENRDTLPKRPYVTSEIVRVSTTDNTLAGGFNISRGYLQATVVIEAGGFATEGLHIADHVAKGFPYGLRLTIPDGTVLITKPPAVGQGFRDGPDWRTPVRVDYEAEENP